MERLVGLTVLAVHRDAARKRLSLTVVGTTLACISRQELAVHWVDNLKAHYLPPVRDRRPWVPMRMRAQHVPPGEEQGHFAGHSLYTDVSGELVALTEWVPGLVSRLSWIARSDEGDCVSFFHDVDNAEALVGQTVTAVDRDRVRTESVGTVRDSEFIRINTVRGTTTIEFRVEHNGFYGGRAEFAGEVAFAPSSAGTRVGLTSDAEPLAGVCIEHEDCLEHVELAHACFRRGVSGVSPEVEAP